VEGNQPATLDKNNIDFSVDGIGGGEKRGTALASAEGEES